jgi:hypothetical protein
MYLSVFSMFLSPFKLRIILSSSSPSSIVPSPPQSLPRYSSYFRMMA